MTFNRWWSNTRMGIRRRRRPISEHDRLAHFRRRCRYHRPALRQISRISISEQKRQILLKKSKYIVKTNFKMCSICKKNSKVNIEGQWTTIIKKQV